MLEMTSAQCSGLPVSTFIGVCLHCQLLRAAQNLNMLTVGAQDGKGGFFPEGIAGRIHTPADYDKLAEGVDDWEGKAEATQARAALC